MILEERQWWYLAAAVAADAAAAAAVVALAVSAVGGTVRGCAPSNCFLRQVSTVALVVATDVHLLSRFVGARTFAIELENFLKQRLVGVRQT
mmetsp:Transcript_23936/g.46572  ORF Transcript_23936/g.46572 Transcript_23936/m.46572 type:complete len:92 (+) Transcript_23936:1582-1857(+)